MSLIPDKYYYLIKADGSLVRACSSAIVRFIQEDPASDASSYTLDMLRLQGSEA